DNRYKNGNTEPAKHKSDSFHLLPPSTRHSGEFSLVRVFADGPRTRACFYFFGRISLPSHSRRRGSPVKQNYDFGALRMAMRSSDQVAGVTGAAPRLPTVERSCSRGLVKPRFALFSPTPSKLSTVGSIGSAVVSMRYVSVPYGSPTRNCVGSLMVVGSESAPDRIGNLFSTFPLVS